MFMGYYNLKDFAMTVSGIKYISSQVFITAIGALASLSDFVNDWIWSDSKAVIILSIVLIADWITGAINGYKSKEGFKTSKFLRILPVFVMHALILMGVQQMFPPAIGTIIFSGIIGVSLISTVKNAALLGWISGDLAKFLESKVDTHKNK